MLCITNLSKGFYGKPILNNINYNFPQTGLVALVGVNGAGKTTFLNILCNLEEPDSGSVSKPKSKTIGYLPQEPNPNPKDSILLECMAGDEELWQIKFDLDQATKGLEDYSHEKFEKFEYLEELYRSKGGYSFEHDTAKILKGLGFTEEQLAHPPKTLSGGWRMRLELAKLLIRKYDFLILDEPTNHLDLPTIEWLESFLKKFKGVVLFVSHDESLLNRLPTMVLHLKGGNLSEYYGNYDNFLTQYEMRELGKVAEIKNIQNKIDSASQFVERFGAKASKATQARSRMKMIARLQGEASQINVDKSDQEINIRIPLSQKSGKEVWTTEECSIGYTKPLIKDLSLIIKRGQKIAIVGANGLGKSTLLKTVINQIPFLKGQAKLGINVKIGYYAQETLEYLEVNKSVLDNLKEANYSITESSARKLLGSFLFKGDDVYKTVKVLSGGEKSRLTLACLLAKEANFLLLDEPTNHLDILSIEILGEALSNYEGTIIFVSHNRSFINNVATHILAVSSKGQTYLSEGDLDELNPKHLE